MELSKLVFGKVGWIGRVVSAQILNWSSGKYPGVRLENWRVPTCPGCRLVFGKVRRPPLDRRGLQCCSSRPAGHSLRAALLAPESENSQSSKQLFLLQNLKTLKVRAASRLSESDQNRQISQFCKQVIASWAKVLS